MAKYVKPLDKDEEKVGGNWKYRLPFALCKQKGIKLPDWATPRDAWNALKRKGIDPNNEYQKAISEREKEQARQRAKEKRKQKAKENKEKTKQAKDTNHSPDYSYEHQEGKIAGVEQGEEMTFEQADNGAPNPHYLQTGLYGYEDNCQTCVVAFEARRRGYDVRALPNNRNPYIRDLSYSTNLAYIDQNGKHPEYMTKMYREQNVKFIDRTVQEGKRYTIEWAWRNSSSGHIINVEKVNGELRFYDPQTNKVMNKEQFAKRHHKQIFNIKIMRVDNCEFNPEYVDYILKGV